MNWPRSGPAAAPTRAATVTGAQPGVVTVRTGRGLASVPAWRFTVAGLGWKVSEVAVARDALVVLPGYVPIPRAGQNTPRVNGLTAFFLRRPDPDSQLHRLGMRCGLGRLPLREQRHGGGRPPWEKPSAGNTPCPAVGMPRTARVMLARPLGTRVILDVASGLPLVSGFQIP